MLCKSVTTEIVKTLNKFVITTYVYNELESSWYDDRHVEPIIKYIQFLVKQRLNKLEHSDIITEWIHNIDTAAYLEQ